MKLITARELTNSFFFRVHLDETKLAQDGAPNPTFVRQFTFTKEPPQGHTRAQYLTAIRAELKALAQLEHNALTLNEGVTLPMEGATL